MPRLSPEIDPMSTIFSGDLSNTHHIYAAAEHIALGEVVATDNGTVWALWGDAAHHKFVEGVHRIKGRDPQSRFGLTLPFSIVFQYADLSRINPELHFLFENPDKLTDLLGGCAFVRFPVSPAAAENSPLVDEVLSHDKYGLPILQNYDPSGKANTELLVISALEQGARLPAASSMNTSGNPEITTVEGAVEFVRDHSLSHAYIDTGAVRLGTGSYFIVEADERGFTLRREGNISNDMVERLLVDLPFTISPDCKRAAGQPMDGLSEYRGSELRQAIIETRGWDKLALTE
jgi:tRNA A37 threonylcarbamoyladenosine synthetase subunit TsaC/SUA5/YrdC